MPDFSIEFAQFAWMAIMMGLEMELFWSCQWYGIGNIFGEWVSMQNPDVAKPKNLGIQFG